MKINFTNKEYRVLLTMLVVADLIIEAKRSGGARRIPALPGIGAEALHTGQGVRMRAVVRPGPGGRHTVPHPGVCGNRSRHGLCGGVPGERVLGDLIHKICLRNTLRRMGLEACHALTAEEKLKELAVHRERYEVEFSAYGFDRLDILESAPLLEGWESTGGNL